MVSTPGPLITSFGWVNECTTVTTDTEEASWLLLGHSPLENWRQRGRSALPLSMEG